MRVSAWYGALLICLAACATPPNDPEARAEFDATNDPAEPTNRTIFDANQFVDRNVLKPVAEAYRDHVPDGVQHGIHNFLVNLRAPIIGFNDLLQGNAGQAWTTVQRFAVNTTVGGLGIFDVAADWGLPYHNADFGQTFGVWGIGEGPFVELPVLGPSNPRDAIGFGLGIVLDPLTWVGGTVVTDLNYARIGTTGIDTRADLLPVTDDVDKNALDPYAAYRSLYRQRRAAFIDEGKAPESPRGEVDIKRPSLRAPPAAEPAAPPN